MLPTDHLPAFLLTVYVLILVPGPSVLFVVSRGVALGRRAALATVLGNTGGLAFQGALVCAGLGSVLARSDAVFTTLKLIGAAYLIILGIRTIRDRGHLAGALSGLEIEPRSPARILREGFVVGATNPKGLLIFTAVLPQFIEPRARSRHASAGHARGDLLRGGGALRRHLGARVRDRAGVVWPLAAPPARDERRRRDHDDGPRRRARPDRAASADRPPSREGR